MQQESLIVKNFFVLKDMEIDIGRFNVFIGEQASGKSLLVKLVYFFRTILHLPISNYQAPQDQIIDFIRNYFNKLFRVESMIQKFDFKVEYQFGKFKISVDSIEAALNVYISDNLKDLYETSRNTLSNIHKQLSDKNTYPFNVQQGLMQANILDLMSKSELGASINSLFFPAGRTFLVSLQRNLFTVLGTMNEDSNASSIEPLLISFGQIYQNTIELYGATSDIRNLNQKQQENLRWFESIAEKILKGKYQYDVTGGYINQECGAVRPWYSSSGQQEFLPIYLILRTHLLNYRKDYLYIEEPEAHLYPTAQKYITELLIYVTNATKSLGLHITTHSPYILTILNNMILSHEVKGKQANFESNLLIPFDEIRAYHLKDGTVSDLRDYESKLIIAESLDEVSEQNALEFERLLDLKYE